MKRNTPLFFTLFSAIVFCATVSQNVFAKTESSKYRLYLKSGLEVMKQPVVEEDPVLSAHGGPGVLVRADCEAGQTVNSGEQCTYPGTQFIFSVAADGRGTFWVASAAKGGTIDSRNSILNGISVNFLAIGNADGSWFLQEVGDDVAGTAGVTVSETALTVTEEDATGDTYTVVLDSEPTANVVVTVAGHSSTDVTPAPATLTFTNQNWETAQTVTVTAGNDADTANDTVSLTHSAAGTDSDYNGISITGVTVTVNDNDTAQVTGVMVAQGNAQLVVNWTAVGNATGYKVQWKSGGQSYNTSTRQATIASGSTTTHTIASLTNDTEYTVRVTATRTGFNDGPPSAEMTGTPAAPAAAGVTVSETVLTVTEEDATGDTYTVVLDSEPTANVVVTVGGHSGTDVTPTPATLTFTNLNWETAQTVTVTAGNDADTANDTVSLTHSAASTDSDYSGISIAGVTVTVNDNDTVQVMDVMVEPGDTELVVEWTAVNNATGYKVQWKSGGQSYNTSTRQAMIASGSTTSYTITSLTNDTEYTVQVTATRTGANDGSPSTEVTGTPEAPATAGVTVSETALTVTEEDATGDTYTVVLDSEPTANVVVTVGGHSGTDVTPTPATLTFTNLNWETAQTVTVKAGNDADTANDTVSLTHSAASTDSDYSGISIAGVTVTVNDNDTGQPAGICGRTEEVRDGIVALISGVTDCADVTAAHLAGITGTLNLNMAAYRFTALAAGDFDGLTALTRLWLNNNRLTTLPDDVFDELTALTALTLSANSLATLPPGVFDGLTALTALTLIANPLTELDDDVFENLTELTRLELSANSLTSLPAGVFDELTKLEYLNPGGNALTTLPAGVFDNNTALTNLWMYSNDLATLPAGVFDNNTALTNLNLRENSLSTLPAGVFENLTELSWLQLEGNPGAPFSPTADALPDDGTVSSAGGTVTLDGSGSDGGPWGANVTYRWAASGATVTFDDTESAKPTVTIPALTAGAELTFTLTVTGHGGRNGTAPDTDTATVTVEAPAANAAPSFTSPATFNAAENQTAVGTAQASDSDSGDSVTGYAIQGGADRSKFSIVASTGVLTFASAPNFEAPADADTDGDYVVVVRATSGAGARVKTAEQTITVTVTDVGGEAPGVPVAPTVSSASPTSLNVSWTAPANAGPPIGDYDYRYGLTSSGPWTEVTNTPIPGSSATIASLAEDTEYYVQVRATNDEGTSGWSAPGSGSTDANASPSFTSSATFSAAENQTAVGTVQASDSDTDDSVTGYAIHGGADRSKFSLVASTGVLTFASAPNFEAPADTDTGNDYVVVVRATSGAGERVKAADQTITVTVTDVGGEAPGVPVAPTVSSASVTSVTAAWAAPANAGPAITDYDYQYRVTSPVGNWTEVTTTTITALSATIGQLAENTEYDVQVQATNGEGTSGWSDSGSGSTDANASPSFTSPETFSAPENRTAVGTVAASDSDTGDSVTGYAIHGGADASKFSIAPATGALTFASAPNFEAPADADTDGDYVVVVRATSGAGARVKTADQAITVTVTDMDDEAPSVPVAPTVSSASPTSVTATWAAPTNAGPAITDYDYRYRVTSPVGDWTEVTTTTITALGATIRQLAENTEYDVQVQATNGEGTSGWSGSGSGSTDANAAPSFTSPETFNVPENRAAVGTVAASDSDTDDSVTGYAIHGGADRSKFSLVASTGVLTFASAPNFEAPADTDTGNDYVVVVRATSGAGARVKTADQTITVTVTDAGGEAPGVPVAPSVSSASPTSVTATWTAPANAGPPIGDYDYRYGVASSGPWTEVTTTTILALEATITQLAEDTEYYVQVRATNDEGTGDWSAPGSGSTDANAAPSFDSPATFSASENRTAVGTVAASDSDTGDSVTGYAIHGGADLSKFSIDAATGALTFVSAPNFEAPSDADTGNDYVVVVRATSGTGERAKTADQTITVTVTNAGGEAPGVPAAPSVSSASATSLNVSWAAPTNAGPAITDYDYRYRAGSPVGNWTEVTTTTITALGATITELAENAGYDVQVRATNDEGTSGWSDSGSGSTDANAAPSFISPATFNAPENRAAVGTVAASDSDTGDSVTGYAIHGGADRSKFSLVASTGVLTFASAPNFEAPADADTGNDYVVVVRATSGAGVREKTADQTITVTVTDVGGEAPGVPVAPFVSSASLTSLTVAWIAPTNAGPAIGDYDYRYRVSSPQGSWTEVTTTTITALSATIGQLVENTEYDVQVRATNDEGTSGWSDPGTGTPTGVTEAGAIANAPENLQATAGNAEVILRWDAPINDSGANITGYAYRYKESGGDFIVYTDIPESGPGEANARSYTVTELTIGLEYVFHVRALNEHGGGLPAEVTVMLPGIVSSENEELPAEVTLSANYPNPFNPETTIRYALPQAGQVRLVVYDLLGHEVAVLVDRSRPAGNHTVRFGAGNLASGLYVYRLQAQGKTIVRTMILVK